MAAATYGRYQPPRRLQIVSGAGTFRAGQYAYALAYDDRGGKVLIDRGFAESAPRERAYLVAKSKQGGALWFSEDGVRFTRSVR